MTVPGALGTAAGALGRPRLHLRETESTNAVAKQLAARGAPHGSLVTAEHQTAGRGRQGRRWEAPPGRALLMSLLVREPPELVSLRAGLAVAEACGEPVRVKWPNDVLVGGRKVGGILAEGNPREGWAVIGIGLNVAVRLADLPAEVRETAATLGLQPGAVEPCLAALLSALHRVLAEPAGTVLERFAALDALVGREVAWNGGRGVASGLDGEGRLRIRTSAGDELLLVAGEVHLMPHAVDGDVTE